MSPKGLKRHCRHPVLGAVITAVTTIPGLFFPNTSVKGPASEALGEKSFPPNVCGFERDPKGLIGRRLCWYIDI